MAVTMKCCHLGCDAVYSVRNLQIFL